MGLKSCKSDVVHDVYYVRDIETGTMEMIRPAFLGDSGSPYSNQVLITHTSQT